MGSITEVDDAILKALKASTRFTINERYGVYTAVQNPWGTPMELQKNGQTIATLVNPTDWLVAPADFFGTPKLDVYTADAWAAISKPNDETPINLDWQTMATPGASKQTYPEFPASPQAGALAGPTPYVAPVATTYAANPGKALSITGLVLAVVPFFAFLGLIFSIVALFQARRGGSSGVRAAAIIGIVINAVLTLFGLLAIIAGATSVMSSLTPALSNSNSGSSSSSKSDVVPSWYAGDAEQLFTFAKTIQPSFEEETIAKKCSYSFLDSHYSTGSNELNLSDSETKALADKYKAELKKLYPKAELSYKETNDSKGKKLYEITALAALDDNYDYATPDIKFNVMPTMTTLTVSAFCN